MLIILLSSHQMVTMENAEEYVELMFDFCMHTGIQKQMEAFRGMTGLAGLKYSHALCIPSILKVHVTWLFRRYKFQISVDYK